MEVATIISEGVAYLPLILGHVDFWIEASDMICSFSEIEDEGSFGNLVLRSEVRVSILCCLVGYLCEAGLVKRKYLAPKIPTT